MASLFLWFLILMAPAPETKRVNFAAEIRPVLEKRCMPCHFAGGKMYDKLPFDQPKTIVMLDTKLFTRIKDEPTRDLIRRFVAQERLPKSR